MELAQINLSEGKFHGTHFRSNLGSRVVKSPRMEPRKLNRRSKKSKIFRKGKCRKKVLNDDVLYLGVPPKHLRFSTEQHW